MLSQPSGKREDEHIVRLIESRSEEGLDALCSHHGEFVKARLLEMFGEAREPDIDEAISDAVLTIWKKIEQFDAARSLNAWLFTISKNYLIAMIRKEEARPLLRLVGVEELDDHMARDSGDLSRSECTRLQLRHLRDCIARLNPMRQDIILTHLVETEHVSNQVLADRWNTTPNAIAKARQKARVQLGKLLKGVRG